MARILIVDDEPDLRDVCAVALRHAGHHVVLTDNGESALAIQRAAPQDVIVLDMFMPIKDGLATLAELREGARTPKIVAVSAGWRITGRRRAEDPASTDVLEDARARGADAVLRKPFDPDDLVRMVRLLLP